MDSKKEDLYIVIREFFITFAISIHLAESPKGNKRVGADFYK